MKYRIKYRYKLVKNSNSTLVLLLFLITSLCLIIISTVNYVQQEQIEELKNDVCELNEIIVVQEKQIEMIYTEDGKYE